MNTATFILRVGEIREFIDKSSVKHTISVSRFSDHDHQHKPIYHPLEANENPDQLVVTIQSDIGALPSSYPPIYASCVTACWEAFRGSAAFSFEYHAENGDEYISCDIRSNPYADLKLDRKMLGRKHEKGVKMELPDPETHPAFWRTITRKATPPNDDFSAFASAQIRSFDNLFVAQDCRKDIVAVVSAIEEGRPILPLCEDKGSFSTIFLPFHAGSMHPFNSRQLAAKHHLPAPLIEFCELAGAIESKTDAYATYEQEPTDEEKRILLPLLKRFLKILPTPEQFRSWFGESA